MAKFDFPKRGDLIWILGFVIVGLYLFSSFFPPGTCTDSDVNRMVDGESAPLHGCELVGETYREFSSANTDSATLTALKILLITGLVVLGSHLFHLFGQGAWTARTWMTIAIISLIAYLVWDLALVKILTLTSWDGITDAFIKTGLFKP